MDSLLFPDKPETVDWPGLRDLIRLTLPGGKIPYATNGKRFARFEFFDLFSLWVDPECGEWISEPDCTGSVRTVEELWKRLDAHKVIKIAKGAKRDLEGLSSNIVTGAQLATMDLPEPVWVVPGLITEGLTILAGPPKIGKSFWILNAAMSVALGGTAFGQIPVQQGKVLALFLEDTRRRIRDRMLMPGAKDAQRLDALHFMTRAPRLDEGLIPFLRSWLSVHQGCRLVAIDTAARVRPAKKKNSDPYLEDYEFASQLQTIGNEFSAGIVVLHHTNQRPCDDPVEKVSGTSGLVGAADCVLVMQRGRGYASATLFQTGRDIEEKELAFEFDKGLGLWSLKGEAREYQVSEARREIFEVLKRHGEVMSPKDIAEELGKPDANIKKLLPKLVEVGFIERVDHGKYEAIEAYGRRSRQAVEWFGARSCLVGF